MFCLALIYEPLHPFCTCEQKKPKLNLEIVNEVVLGVFNYGNSKQ
jgi:hypothetical protein